MNIVFDEHAEPSEGGIGNGSGLNSGLESKTRELIAGTTEAE